jgi:hypothetical protein
VRAADAQRWVSTREFMKRLFMLPILTCALSLGAIAQTSDGLDRTATSSIKAARDKDGNSVITTINRRFMLVDVPTQPLPGALLLLEEFRREHQLGTEGGKGFVKVDAWFGENVSKKAWTIEQDGDEGRVFDEFYRVTKYGCCASIATNFFFNLETGQRVFSSTGELLTVIVPNTGLYRYVAYHSNDAIIPPLEPRVNEFRGLLQYGTTKTPLWKLAIYSKIEPIARIKFQYENKIVESGSLMLWGADGKKDKSSLSHFAIVISLGSSDDIVLPITNDTFDLTKATIPPRYRIEIVK